MQRLPLILGAAAFGTLALAAPAQAGCNPVAEKITGGSAIIYDGAVGDEPARIALIFGKDGRVEARYALATSPAEILLRGKIEPGGERMTLTELDESGQPRAVFAATFSATRPIPMISTTSTEGGTVRRFYGPATPATPPGDIVQLPSSPGCSVISGSWQETGGSSAKTLELKRSRTIDHPQFGHLYAIAGVADDEIVNRKAQAFRQAVVDGRPEEVARHIRLPMTFTVRGKLVIIANAQDLKTRFDDVFPSGIREQIAKLVPRMMTANESGITLTPTMWFDSEGYLIAF